MKLKDYFFLCMKNEMYINREWILATFAIIPRDRDDQRPFMPVFKDKECFMRTEDGGLEKLTDFKHMQPLFHLTKQVEVITEDFPFFDEDQISSYGNLVIGMCIFVWALKQKIPFANSPKPITSQIDDIVSQAIRDKVLDIENDYKNYIKALDFVTVFADFITPVGSEKMFLPNKKVLALRDKLVKQYADQLSDPAVAAFVEGEITKLDTELLAGDPAMGFLNKKMINTVRKKIHYVQGVSASLKDPSKVDFGKSSLTEGVTVEDLPTAINSLRSGSYSRGKQTAIGGVFTKQLQRSFGNANIGSEDCGTKIGIPIELYPYNKKFFEGRYDAKTGKLINYEVGKTIYMRDPGTCQEPDGNICQKCLGDRVGKSGMNLGSLTISFSGAILDKYLSAFHSTDLELQRLNLKQQLR